MHRLAADDRSVGIASACRRGDPESLIGCVAVTLGCHAHTEKHREAERDRIVLVRPTCRGNDDTVEIFEPALAVLLGREIVGVRSALGQAQDGLHANSLASSWWPSRIASGATDLMQRRGP